MSIDVERRASSGTRRTAFGRRLTVRATYPARALMSAGDKREWSIGLGRRGHVVLDFNAMSGGLRTRSSCSLLGVVTERVGCGPGRRPRVAAGSSSASDRVEEHLAEFDRAPMGGV